VGYDIVDLALTDEVRSALPGFRHKILSPFEVSRPAALSHHQYLWLCWSVKEAVYKYACRLRPGLVFSPTGIVIESLDDGFSGIARWGSQSYHFDATLTGQYIATVAHDGPVLLGFRALSEGADPSRSVRAMVLSAAGPGWSVERREDGCPTLVGPSSRVPVSFSHHGAYAGYASLKLFTGRVLAARSD
jgi:phosphopantetheinyl transferase (holo-ACP synthase)